MSGSYIRRAALGCAFAIATGATAAMAQTTVKEIVVHPKSSQLAETRHKTVSYADLDLSSRAGSVPAGLIKGLIPNVSGLLRRPTGF